MSNQGNGGNYPSTTGNPPAVAAVTALAESKRGPDLETPGGHEVAPFVYWCGGMVLLMLCRIRAPHLNDPLPSA